MPDTFGAKQVATRIGTDPKTFRKFLRSNASPYEAVGQGARYEFSKDELESIKRAFIKWQKGKRPKAIPTKPHTYVHNPLFRGDTGIDPDSARRRRESNFTKELEEFGIVDEPTEEDLTAIEEELEDE